MVWYGPLLDLLVISVIVTGVLSAVIYFSGTYPWNWSFLFFSLCLLGVTAGWLTGNSRDAAVPDVVPAVLTFVGGLTTYLAVARSKDMPSAPLLLASCTIALAVPFFLGTLSGSNNRTHLDDPDVQFERQAAEEHNRFRLEILKMQNDARLKKLSESP